LLNKGAPLLLPHYETRVEEILNKLLGITAKHQTWYLPEKIMKKQCFQGSFI
jgi:hypothetical protein